MYPDTLTEMDRFLASGGFQSIKFSSVVFSSIYLAETIQICCLSAACHMALVENNKANQMKKFVVNTSKGSFHPRHIEKDTIRRKKKNEVSKTETEGQEQR